MRRKKFLEEGNLMVESGEREGIRCLKVALTCDKFEKSLREISGVLPGPTQSHKTNFKLWGLSEVLRPPPKSGKVGELSECLRHSWV